jgi:hypothetical protein
VSKTAWGVRPFSSLRRKNSEYKILLVRSFGELKGDLTGSSNSKSFSIEKIQELIRNNTTITVIQHTSSSNNATRLDSPIPSCSNTVYTERWKEADIHKARSLKCQYITKATNASSKLYNREPSSTIDTFQNTIIENIYSEQCASLGISRVAETLKSNLSCASSLVGREHQIDMGLSDQPAHRTVLGRLLARTSMPHTHG